MAKEATIRKRAKERLDEAEDDWTYWIPTATAYHQNDAFGIFDLIAIRPHEGLPVIGEDLIFIQYTSRSNVSARINKIEAFFEENDCFIPCEVWGYENRKGFTRVEKLTNEI